MGTKKHTYDVLIDWLEFTINNMSLPLICKGMNIEYDKLVRYETGFFEYDVTYVYGEKIKFLLKSIEHDLSNSNISILNDDPKRMGVHVVLSGYACREIENIIPWNELLLFVFENANMVSRIDIAFDLFSDRLINLPRIKKYLKNGCIVSHAKKGLNTEERELITGSIIGHSVKIGSSSSEIMVMIYNKLQERNSANYVVSDEIKAWNRIELRLRKDKSKEFLKYLFMFEYDVPGVALSILNGYVSFKKLQRYQTDTNRSRWLNVEWWDKFIDNAKKLKLSNKAIQSTIQRKEAWLEKSVEKTLASVFCANIDDVTPDSLIDFVNNGIDKFNRMSLKQINTYRLQNGYSVLDQHDLDLIKHNLSKYTNK